MGLAHQQVMRISMMGPVPAYGAIGSLVFKPVEALAAMRNYKTFPNFWSKYGFKDAYNLSHNNGWYATDIIGC